MRRSCALALWCVALAAILGGCAMAGKTGPPAAAYEPAYREQGPYKKVTVAEPQTIAAWETRVQSHAAMLHALLPGAGGGATSPAGPSPRAQPHRARSMHPSPTPPQTATGARLSIRCRRICRHVRAICYAARRICQIAARIGGESARAACERNRRRCQSARTVTTRRGCTGCGQTKRRRSYKNTRRACLR